MRSIYWKITLPIIAIILLGIAALGYYTIVAVRASQLDEMRSHLINEARLVGDAGSPSFLSGDGAVLDALAKTAGEQISARITLIRRDGVVLGDTWEDPARMDNHASRPEIAQALAEGTGVSTRYSTTERENMMYAAVTVQGGGDIVGFSRVALPLTAVEATVNNTTRAIVLTLVTVALLIVLITAFITRRIISPIKEITHATASLAEGRLGVKVPESPADEIGTLGRAFNSMSYSLAKTLAELNSERERLSTVLSSIADGVLLISSKGDVVLANQAAGRLFGFAEKESAGQPVNRIINEPEVEQVLTSTLRTGQRKSVQFDSRRNRYMQVIAVPLAYGEYDGAVLLCQDLTELRDLQTMRKDLVGNISHEFRTPLAGIRALVETLEGGAIADPPAAQEFLGKIHGEVDRLTQMVSELTELSRIESGRTTLKKEFLDLNALIKDIAVQMEPLAHRHGLRLDTWFEPALPKVGVDADRLRHVLANLVHNAIKFTPSGGRITLISRLEPEQVVVQVADTGVGISPQDLPHVFERFYKADRARAGGGTGLGLAIVKHTVQAHGGRVWVESAPGKGSTFSFSLPLKA